MKTKIILSIIAISVAMTFDSCLKKGDDDPFISIRTRNARLTGKWKLMKLEETYSRNGNDPSYPQNTTYSFNGSTMTETFTGVYWTGWGYTDTSYTNTYSYSLNNTINKDGTYSSDGNDKNGPFSNSGPWSWLDSQKKKTEILLDDIFVIDRLTNKEMILKYDYHYKSGGGSNWYEYTESMTQTFEKQ